MSVVLGSWQMVPHFPLEGITFYITFRNLKWKNVNNEISHHFGQLSFDTFENSPNKYKMHLNNPEEKISQISQDKMF